MRGLAVVIKCCLWRHHTRFTPVSLRHDASCTWGTEWNHNSLLSRRRLWWLILFEHLVLTKGAQFSLEKNSWKVTLTCRVRESTSCDTALVLCFKRMMRNKFTHRGHCLSAYALINTRSTRTHRCIRNVVNIIYIFLQEKRPPATKRWHPSQIRLVGLFTCVLFAFVYHIRTQLLLL